MTTYVDHRSYEVKGSLKLPCAMLEDICMERKNSMNVCGIVTFLLPSTGGKLDGREKSN